MRLNYYMFPEDVDSQTRFKEGAAKIKGECSLSRDTCRGCEYNHWTECDHFNCIESETTIDALSITAAKKLLKKYGGFAWIEHYERDGVLFETTEITLNGNNSRFKYNHHL